VKRRRKRKARVPGSHDGDDGSNAAAGEEQAAVAEGEEGRGEVAEGHVQ